MPRPKKPEATKFVQYSLKLPSPMLRELRDMQKVTHVLVSEQIRQGIDLWLKSQRKRARGARGR